MNTSAEAADQVVRMSLNGAEAALKISGSASKEVAKLLFKALKDLSKQSKKTKGQMRLSNLVKSGKKLEIYQVSDANLKRFCEQAKKYGMIYTVLKDRNKNDGITEVMVKAEDKAKIDRIFERLGLVPESVAEVAALGVDPDYFNLDLKTFGFIFETLCIRDLKVYSAAHDGKVSYYRDRYGLEADCVLHLRDGRYALIEFKLGSSDIEDGAKHLTELEKLIKHHNEKEKQVKLRLPDLKIVITGTQYGYKRPDGVLVVPIGCLKD